MNTKKTGYIRFLLCGMIAMACIESIAQTFTFQTFNPTNTPVLTVTAFRSVTVDKRGKIWAGSDLGGLYTYRDSQWVKIGTYPDITFRHMVPSNMPGDSNVWATSIGKTGAQAISGGAYLIKTNTETVTQYGSGIAGGLSSRYGNSLALSSQGMVYVALAQSLTGSTTNQGGVYKTNTVNPPPPSATSFTKAIGTDQGDIIYHSAGNRADEMWFGRGANCSGTCIAPYIARLNSSGVLQSPITAANSPLPFTNTSASAFPRVIFTDSILGNTFVGLSSGGVGIYKNDGTWKMITSANSPFPASAAVNFNAIAEVYGEVWIGTTFGIFVYNGFGSLDSASSFKMLTTANGLPSDNITDIAMDTARSYLWVTSFAGVSRTPYKSPFIRGYVFDVFVNKSPVKLDSVADLHPTLQKVPLASGVDVKLYRNGSLVDSSKTNSAGMFQLTRAVDGENYDVDISYLSPKRYLHFVYENVKNHTFIGNVLMPDKLMDEVIAFKANATTRRFGINLKFNITFRANRVDGFNTAEYQKGYEKFEGFLAIKDLHKARVENLAGFYCAVAGAYHMGGSSTGLMNMSIQSAWEFIESIISSVKFNAAAKLARPQIEFKYFLSKFKLRKETEFLVLKKLVSTNPNPEAKNNLEKLFSFMSDYIDLALDVLENADKLGEVRQNIALDLTKRIVAAKLADFYYYNYCNTRHASFVSSAANAAYMVQSKNLYENTFNRVYNPSGGSLVKTSLDNLEAKKIIIENSNTLAKFAELTSKALDAASLLRIVPGGQLAGLAVKGLAIAAKVVKVAAHANAMITGVNGAFEIAQSSNNVLPYADLAATALPLDERVMHPSSQQSPNDLSTIKDLYNQKLVQLKAFYNAPTYDSVLYFAKFNDFGATDSAYSDEQRKVINRLLASTDSAAIYIPGFETKLNKVVDSFITKQYTLRDAFFYQNLAYSFDPDKADYLQELNGLADSIIGINDSSFNGLTSLINDININGIAAPANLIQDSYKLNHTRNLGDSGSFAYVFTNYGGQPQQNVSFKISQPTAGYQIMGADSIYIGTINPSQSVSITFSFKAPLTDSSGSYMITVRANNGKYQNVSGTLNVYDPNKYYSVKDGNWSNPETWINNTVPGINSLVEVNHNVMVDIDVSCKTLKSLVPGAVTVLTGKKLTILQ